MILGLQVIAIIFALIMIYFAYLHYSRGELNGLEILAWLLIWIVTIGIIIFPEVLQTFAKSMAIARVFDFMVIGGFVFVIPIVYLSYIRTKRTEKKLEGLVRSEALKKIRKSPKKK
ncbi:hypothetical protein A3D83_04885 [Candidatus Daviesbacteria bacterium RIFCSPHIGHO2_02_FULL_41_10]|uniref:DUF2304 domain-containing protein n=2 Tax=Candidatus Daviesiibacteriota TaxID=1752718 RepID=A0A1F5ISS9_9BACT|nr:MAG: hypothetical protein A2871_00880 [Candidatus Daviesbacteria bacterium RIFCSPHIGHO2_01_FULL_41_23]OGE32972.1 MAG: hypothetical protein A3D83_04885 [Candidatus Daviesbacteria bacterium RIFCSPHIGHO2_02_FULL_41_10]OGE62448.1 MAG: hypothetical protein A2967_01365 [Candidatus Daviesbacteria bacterium RIFCSPLOWO2_01_FULL_41_32]